MKAKSNKKFKAIIYKVGINACADVPPAVTKTMTPAKGYIKIKGTVNGFAFKQTLVPVKNGPYRLYVNIPMLKGGKTEPGKQAVFCIEQNFEIIKNEYPMPGALRLQLRENNLTKEFKSLTPSRQKEILRYLNYIKTEITLQKNIDKLIHILRKKEKNVRMP